MMVQLRIRAYSTMVTRDPSSRALLDFCLICTIMVAIELTLFSEDGHLHLLLPVFYSLAAKIHFPSSHLPLYTQDTLHHFLGYMSACTTHGMAQLLEHAWSCLTKVTLEYLPAFGSVLCCESSRIFQLAMCHGSIIWGVVVLSIKTTSNKGTNIQKNKYQCETSIDYCGLLCWIPQS